MKRVTISYDTDASEFVEIIEGILSDCKIQYKTIEDDIDICIEYKPGGQRNEG